MTFVERITQAVHIAANEAAADQEQYCSERMAKAAALAALKAMREPSEAMVDAGYASPGWDDTGCSDRGDASNCFTAMIDAAIKEAEGE